MVGAKINGASAPAKKDKTVAATKKPTKAATAAATAKKRAADDTEDEENNVPTAKRVKKDASPAPKKAVVKKTAATKAPAPKKAAVSKAVATKAAPKKAAPKKEKTPAPEEEKEEGDNEADNKDTDALPVAAPAPSVPSIKPTGHVHKVGVKINEAPTQKLDIYVFGEGSSGELGLGSARVDGKNPVDVQRPRLNSKLSAKDIGVVQIAVGGMHCAALTHDNKIYSWGVNDQGALGRDTTWDGGLKDMGDADSDDGEMNPMESTPYQVDGRHFAENAVFVQLIASDSATFALTEDGAVYGWGTFRNNEGILGFNEKVKVQWTPVLVPELKKITNLASGSNHILALNNKGKVLAWGAGQQGQLGRRVVERFAASGLQPREFGLKGPISKISCGSYHSFAINVKGEVYSWGLNSYGETGVNDDLGGEESSILKPQVVETLKKYEITEISGGSHHSIACTKDGKALVWGRCDGGQLGIDVEALDENDVIKDEREKVRIVRNPVPVDGIEGEVNFVDAGSDNCFAVTAKGEAWSWGFNANYQTGLGGDDDVEEATLIENSAVKGKKIVGALSGGQFGVLYGMPSA